MSSTVTLSRLLRDPKSVIAHLDGGGDVLVTRRNEPDLRLSLAEASERQNDALAAIALLIEEGLDKKRTERLAAGLHSIFPWLEFIPEAYRGDFIDEFLRTLHACAQIGAYEPLDIVIAAWKDTARAYAEGLASSPASYLDEPEEVPNPKETPTRR